jgi:hypothetical protein
MNGLLTRCPVCAGPFHAERLACDACSSTLEGRFSLDWLGRLNRDQLEFVKLMIKNRGNINGVAAELKVAYNTARSRLDDIVAALGYGAPPVGDRPSRREVLDRVASGELTVEEAMVLLRR